MKRQRKPVTIGAIAHGSSTMTAMGAEKRERRFIKRAVPSRERHSQRRRTGGEEDRPQDRGPEERIAEHEMEVGKPDETAREVPEQIDAPEAHHEYRDDW